MHERVLGLVGELAYFLTIGTLVYFVVSVVIFVAGELLVLFQ